MLVIVANRLLEERGREKERERGREREDETELDWRIISLMCLALYVFYYGPIHL